MVGLSSNSISQIENDAQVFKIDKLINFTSVFESSTDYILNGDARKEVETELIHEIKT